MFRIALRIVRKSETVMHLTPGSLFRILFALICVSLMLGIYLNPGQNIPVLGIIIILISLVAVFYEERWIFDREKQIIEYRFGLLFFSRKERVPFDTVDEFNYSNTAVIQRNPTASGEEGSGRSGFMMGRQVKYSVFSLITTDGKVRNIEVLKTRSGTELRDKATETAKFCGFELKST